VNYPEGWNVRHAVDEYGIEFTSGADLFMSFGVMKDSESLEDNFRTAYLTGGDLKVVERQDIRFQGGPAIVATLGSDTLKSVRHVERAARDDGGRSREKCDLRIHLICSRYAHPQTRASDF
jgi:hypothetical protein